MSRIGRKHITVPAGVKVAIKDRTVSVTGPLGTLNFTHRPEVQVAYSEAEKAIVCTVDEKTLASNADASAFWGTTRATINANIEGVTKGYRKEMEVVGVGWTAAVQGDKLKLTVGFANPILMPIPKGLKVSVDKQFVKVEGPDKKMVGQFASDMRAKRKPEPYNGKGIKYKEEVIKKKAGKAFGTA
ncbi:MAG: 50S ribosomal protein L6 [Phycisphaerales bacterium]|jgi:large subunit ribosomal protein L6|nr:50S ribosomal protein L6 [Phycisphaeraceae bacterium]